MSRYSNLFESFTNGNSSLWLWIQFRWRSLNIVQRWFLFGMRFASDTLFGFWPMSVVSASERTDFLLMLQRKTTWFQTADWNNESNHLFLSLLLSVETFFQSFPFLWQKCSLFFSLIFQSVYCIKTNIYLLFLWMNLSKKNATTAMIQSIKTTTPTTVAINITGCLMFTMNSLRSTETGLRTTTSTVNDLTFKTLCENVRFCWHSSMVIQSSHVSFPSRIYGPSICRKQ